MKKIISKANEMFLKLGFKSITMDDIIVKCVFLKNDLQIFCNKKLLVEELQHFCIKKSTKAILLLMNIIMPLKKTLRYEKCLAKCLNHLLILLPIYQLKTLSRNIR
jgi:hypothetical protein